MCRRCLRLQLRLRRHFSHGHRGTRPDAASLRQNDDSVLSFSVDPCGQLRVPYSEVEIVSAAEIGFGALQQGLHGTELVRASSG